MAFVRSAGILLHPTSLPGNFGIGDLGRPAYNFADFLKASGQKIWQVLPLNTTGYGYSPYQCVSAFAGNPLLIDLNVLVHEGFLDPPDLQNPPSFSEISVDFDAVANFKLPLLKKSFGKFTKNTFHSPQKHYDQFIHRNAYWLDTYAFFMAVREAHKQSSWIDWERGIRNREPGAIKWWTDELHMEIEYYHYEQYQFFRQWTALKEYCNKNSISIIGDMPIFVSLDSDAVWSNPDLFYLDAEGRPIRVAGVPPDYFSSTGQLWGNPIYRWDTMAQDGYNWWGERFRQARRLVDTIRIDHFRGFESYWSVPALASNAIDGCWQPGPGLDFFIKMKESVGDLPLIAEDLGVITPQVDTLREEAGLPGMRVLQFAFGPDPKADEYKPHNYPHNCVVYTGTHDNDTTIGWFKSVETGSTLSLESRKMEIQNALKYLGTDGREINWDFICLALKSVADTAIYPLQDVLGLGSEARMNTPGTSSGNWRWRFSAGALSMDIQYRLAELTKMYGR